MLLEFKDYEVENLLKALEMIHYEELKKGKWEMQEHSKQYYYSPTKKSNQIKFTINSIKRQINKEKELTKE